MFRVRDRVKLTKSGFSYLVVSKKCSSQFMKDGIEYFLNKKYSTFTVSSVTNHFMVLDNVGAIQFIHEELKAAGFKEICKDLLK